ncbi:hypothetical protein JCM5296_005650 [Sporobolomyces johnsonii]
MPATRSPFPLHFFKKRARSRNRLGLISASSYLPGLVLLPTFSWACDHLGRRVAAAIGCVLIIVGSIVGAVAKNEGTLIAGRCIVGTATSLAILACNLLLNEILHPRLRSVGSAFFLAGYYIGSTTSAWITYGIVASNWTSEWSWRLPTLLQALGPVVVLIGLLIVPESPRWLIAHGKRDKAHMILAAHHANGDLDDPLVCHEMVEIEEALAREKRDKAGIRTFFATKGNRHRLVILVTVALGSQCNGVSLFSYYLAPVMRTIGITSPTQQLGINGGLNIFNLFWACFGALTCERFGRRTLWIYATVGMVLCYAALIGLSAGYADKGTAGLGYGVIVFIFLCFGCYDVAWTPLSYSYPTEVLPYSLRASGMAAFVWLQYAAVVFNQWVNPVALDAAGWKWYFFFFVVLLILLALILWKFPETKGLSLEEVSLIFDDNNGGRSLREKKEAVDAEFKIGSKETDVRHIEDGEKDAESV